MTEKTLIVNESHYWDYASRAVSAYACPKFGNYFTNEDYEDMTGETVERILRYRHVYDPSKSQFATWVGVIARNRVNTWASNKKKRTDISCEMPLDEDGFLLVDPVGDFTADGGLILRETTSQLFESAGNDTDRTILSLKLDGFDSSEIAQITGLGVNQVYSRWFKTKNRILDAA